MTCLLEVNGATRFQTPLFRAVSRFRRCRDVRLLHVIPSGRAAEMEAGRRVLRDATRTLRILDPGLKVEARLAIGDPVDQLLRAADETGAELIVMGAHGEGEFPRLNEVGRTVQATLERARRPVLLVSAIDMRLHRPRRPGRLLRRARPTRRPSPTAPDSSLAATAHGEPYSLTPALPAAAIAT